MVNQADLIEGIWKEGKLDGHAKLTFHNGCVLPVKFLEGKLVNDEFDYVDFTYLYFDSKSRKAKKSYIRVKYTCESNVITLELRDDNYEDERKLHIESHKYHLPQQE